MRSWRTGAPDRIKMAGRSAYIALGRSTAAVRIEPEFILAGAQRCGTTSLFRVLMAHPQIVRPTFHKGVNYFDVNYDKDIAWYRGHFPTRVAARLKTRRAGTPVSFDASGYYMYHPFAMQRLAHALPDAKIVVMLRDPVERAYSAFQHETARGYEWESFERALELEDERLVGEFDRMAADVGYESFTHRHHSYRHRGQYAEQLEPIIELFGAERVHILESERFFAEPAQVYADLLGFLGLPAFVPNRFDRYNARDRAPMSEKARLALEEHYAPYDAKLTDLLARPPAWTTSC